MAEEKLIGKNDHAVRLPAFEGPLDLLLFLIRRNEVDIYEIPVQSVLEQYLEILRKMKKLDLEVAGEFFVMASTLMYIKSRLLLPQEKREKEERPDDEDDVDPRWELVQQLLQYRRVKEAASDLQTLIENANELLPRRGGADEEAPARRPLRQVDRVEVWNTFNRALRRLSERLSVGEIEGESVTVAERMEIVLARLRMERSFLFSTLIERGAGQQTFVSTFLALLELARLRRLDLYQEASFEDIHCVRIEESAGQDWLAGNDFEPGDN